MVRAVHELDAHALDGRAGELPVVHRLLDPLVHGRAVALRDDAAHDLVDELVLALLERRDDDVAVAELTPAAGLLLVPAVRARLPANRLAVRNARRVQLDVDAEPPLRPLERDLDMHLAHSGEDLLAGLLVASQVQRLILLGETANRGRDLLLVALRLRRDREAHDGLREAEVRNLDRDLLVHEEVARSARP